MINSIFYYVFTQLRNSKFIYFGFIAALYFFYLQTFAVDVRSLESPEFFGVAFTDGWIDLPNYIKLLGLHFFCLLFIILVPLSTATHSFFNSQISSFFLIRDSKRVKTILIYFMVVISFITVVYTIYILFLNLYFALSTGSLFFLPSLYSTLYLLPQFAAITVVVVCFSILIQNGASSLFATLSYLIIIPFALWVMTLFNTGTESYLSFLFSDESYLFPFHLDIYVEAYLASFSFSTISSLKILMPGILLLSVVAIFSFRRKA